jgi:hypothetical protein
VFETARDLEKRYDELGMVRLRGMPNEEPLIGLAMAVHDQHPIPDDGTIKAEPMFFSGRTSIDVFSGRAHLFNLPGIPRPFYEWQLPESANPAVVHFNCSFADEPPYTTEAFRLELVLRRGWPLWAATLFASTTRSFPFAVRRGIKSAFRPLYHSLLGNRRIKKSVRVSN